MRSSIASGLRRSATLGWAVAGALASFSLVGIALAQSPALGSSGAGTPAGQTLQAAPAISDPRSADTALEQARRLVAENRPDDALAAIEVALQTSPSDARLRFTKGVILGEQGRNEQAVEVFRGLTQDFPELPEPYNNLAALHAARGELDLARAALDEAVRALPSYAIAHANLGDVHLRLAMRAWQRAAQLDPANAEARAKLARAQSLADSPAPAAAAPAKRAAPASGKGNAAASAVAPSPSPATTSSRAASRPATPAAPALPGAR
jgi:colicin import membrane protein